MNRSVRYLIVLGAFSAATVLWLLPLVAHLGSSVLNGASDATSGTRDYWAAERQGATPFTLNHDRLMDAPEGTDVSTAVQIAMAIQPAFVLVAKELVGFVAAMNLYMLAGVVLSGLLMFVLLDRVGLHTLASAFGGYVYAFNPYMFAKLEAGHVGLVHAWIFPLLALLLLGLRRRRTPAAAAMVGGAMAVAFYLHSYYGLFALVLAGVFMAVDLVRAPREERGRSFLLSVASFAGATVAFAPALVAAIRDPGAIGSASHRIEALQLFGSRVGAYLLPAERNPLLGDLVGESTRKALNESNEATLFFGYTTIALALAGIVLLLRRHGTFSDRTRRSLAVSAAVLVPVAYVMSLPRLVDVLGLELPMPAYFIGEVTTTIRVYARFGVLVGLGLVVLAAFALDALIRGRRHGALLAAGALALVGIELSYAVPAPIWRTDQPPAYDRWLAKQPEGIVAFYPSPGDKEPEVRFAREQYFFQTVHGQPLFFSGSPKKSRAWAIRALADHVEDDVTAGILAAEGVRYVVVDPTVYRETPGEDAPTVPTTLYRQIAAFGEARIYAVIAPPADLDEVLHREAARVAAAMGIPQPRVTVPGQGFNDSERAADGSQSAWMIQDGFVVVDSPTSAAELELATEGFSAHGPRRLELIAPDGSVLAATDVPTNSEKIRLGPFRLPKGTHTLRLRADPGPAPLGSNDSRLASVFLAPIDVRPVADYSRR